MHIDFYMDGNEAVRDRLVFTAVQYILSNSKGMSCKFPNWQNSKLCYVYTNFTNLIK